MEEAVAINQNADERHIRIVTRRGGNGKRKFTTRDRTLELHSRFVTDFHRLPA